MEIPKLNPSGRKQEYKARSSEEISEIVYTWLFTNDVGHREMDKKLGFSKGFQSMGVLHYLGLRKEFKGIFVNSDLNQAIEQLEADEQDFSLVIGHLKNTSANSDSSIIESLYETGKTQDKNFEEHYKFRLNELEDTDRQGNQTQSRKEQGILRAILFKDVTETQCAICQRTFPTDLMVAAHIKPRSKCSALERKNPNVVMPVCKVGCDDFFEEGYIIVDTTGVIRVNQGKNYSPELKSILTDTAGKRCTHFNNDTAKFFSYKRNISLTPASPSQRPLSQSDGN